MGRTKALVEVDGVPMGLRVAASLTDAGCAPVVALGGDPAALAPLGLAVLADAHPGAGPLAAVVTALSWADSLPDRPRDVMVLACDLPFVTAADLGRLTAGAQRHPDADVVVGRTDRLEPGCAIWRTPCRQVVAALVDAGERAVHRAIAHLDHVEVDVDPDALRNINTPADLPDYPGRHEW
jgi:molybdenum cofactor guanylyltransferase